MFGTLALGTTVYVGRTKEGRANESPEHLSPYIATSISNFHMIEALTACTYGWQEVMW